MGGDAGGVGCGLGGDERYGDGGVGGDVGIADGGGVGVVAIKDRGGRKISRSFKLSKKQSKCSWPSVPLTLSSLDSTNLEAYGMFTICFWLNQGCRTMNAEG